MRILIDLPPAEIDELAALGRRRQASRVGLIRDAVRLYLAANRPPPPAAAFGAWGQGEDGIAYQDRVRAEW